MYSYWESSYWFDNYDFVVIGAGIVGLSTAIELRTKFSEAKILVLERGHLPTGASTKNAGFACFGTISEISDDLSILSDQEVIDLIKLRWKGLSILRDRIPAAKMDMRNYGGYEIFIDQVGHEKYLTQLQHINALIENAIGHKDVIQNIGQKFSQKLYEKCFFNRFESQLNPVLLMRFLLNQCYSQNVQIKFSAKVRNFERKVGQWDVYLDDSLIVKSKKLVLCTNAFSKNILENLDVIPYRNQVIISKPIEHLQLKGTFHFNKGYTYFRNIDNRLLIGGARNIDMKMEQTDQFGANDKIIKYLVAFANEYLLLKPMEIERTWSGIIATGQTKNVLLRKENEDLYIGLRLGGMGVAIGSAVAKELVELIDL